MVQTPLCARVAWSRLAAQGLFDSERISPAARQLLYSRPTMPAGCLLVNLRLLDSAGRKLKRSAKRVAENGRVVSLAPRQGGDLIR